MLSSFMFLILLLWQNRALTWFNRDIVTLIKSIIIIVSKLFDYSLFQLIIVFKIHKNKT